MRDNPPRKNNKPREKKQPKRITADYLHNSGLYYLQRYAASSGHFRQVMLRKVKKSCMVHLDQSYETCVPLVDALVEKFKSSGLLNDDLYLRGVVGSLRRRGTSKQTILNKLRMKSVSADVTTEYLQECDTDFAGDGNGDLKAAIIFARKKKLGPFAGTRVEEPQKTLAKLARAGFSYDTANKVLKMGEDEALEKIY